MKVLVTGGSGFVGRHLIAALRARGDSVLSVDLVPFDRRDIPRQSRLHVIEHLHSHHLMDAREWFRRGEEHFDLVLHCAAIVGGRRKIEGAPLDLAVDLALDADLFGWAMRTRAAKIVYFSSSAAYPTLLQTHGSDLRLREDHIDLDMIQTPDHVYGWTKLTGEILARHARNAGLDVLVVRPFSGYGHDQDLDYPFPSFIDRATRRADPFDIWGDGEQVRDFIHIDDICAGVLAAVDQNIEGPLNLGTGRGTSFNDLATLICAQTGYRPRFRRLEGEPVGVRHRVADPTRMREFFRPQVALETGVMKALTAAGAFV